MRVGVTLPTPMARAKWKPLVCAVKRKKIHEKEQTSLTFSHTAVTRSRSSHSSRKSGTIAKKPSWVGLGLGLGSGWVRVRVRARVRAREAVQQLELACTMPKADSYVFTV